MEKIKVYMRGWLNYYGIADMKNNIESLNGWLYRRIRMCIWKQWKLPRTRMRNWWDWEWTAIMRHNSLRPQGILVQCRKQSGQLALSKERLINWGFYDLTTAYQSLHSDY